MHTRKTYFCHDWGYLLHMVLWKKSCIAVEGWLKNSFGKGQAYGLIDGKNASEILQETSNDYEKKQKTASFKMATYFYV